MTLEQFKSWFEGFTEALSGPPTAEQWARIKDQVAKLRATPAVTLRELNEFERTWLENDKPTPGPRLARGAVETNFV